MHSKSKKLSITLLSTMINPPFQFHHLQLIHSYVSRQQILLLPFHILIGKLKKTASLNFADYLEAGGGYLRGIVAQEEALCLESDLYQCLAPFEQTYYKWNNAHINHSLYENRALYSPNILFAHPKIYAQVDIISCAAPNYTQVKLSGISYRNACLTLQNRMTFVKQIAESQHVAHLILGAWGAGVFGFKAKDVAQMWYNVFKEKSSIKKVTFAVIDDHRNSAAQDFKNLLIKS